MLVFVAELSADYEMECRMLENNSSAGLNRAKIERAAGKRLLRQQQDSKALSASQGTTKVDRGKVKDKRPCNKFEGNYLIAERKVTALGNPGARREKKSEMPPSTRRAEIRANATPAGVGSILRKRTVISAGVLSTGLASMRSEELRSARWQN